MFFYNAKICPQGENASEIENGYICIEDGIITDLAEGAPKKITDRDINLNGLRVYPGFIDIHTHIGLIGDGQGAEGEDVNEDSDPITPHLRTIDGLCFTDGYFSDAVKAGVTACVTGVGSTNPIGGDLVAIHTNGRCADEMLIKRVGIKLALGENPKSTFSERDSAPITRMATAALIREALYKAKRYLQDKSDAEENGESMPEYDIKSEALAPLLNREIKAHFHCHRADDIMTAVRIAEEFKLDYVLVHCTEGYKIADLLGEKGASAIAGPIICDRGKPELSGLTVANAGILYKNGVGLAICTDHPEIPIQYLPTSAAYCVKEGLPRETAIRAITSNAAAIAGIDHVTGDLAIGRSADMVVTDGDPLEIMTNVKMTIIKGKIVYNNL